MTKTPWTPANNGSGARIWFLLRRDESIPIMDRYHFGADGRLIRYASSKGAQRAADKLNRAERAS